jgi:hypothetical protein
MTMLNAHESYGDGWSPVLEMSVRYGGMSVGLVACDALTGYTTYRLPFIWPENLLNQLPDEQYEEGKRVFIAYYMMGSGTIESAICGYTIVARLYHGQDPEPWTVSTNYVIELSSERIHRKREAYPASGRDMAPCYAAETRATDIWLLDRPARAHILCGAGERTITQVWNDEMQDWDPWVFQGEEVNIDCITGGGNAGNEYARISLNWSNVPVDFSHRVSNRTAWRLQGEGNMVKWYATQTHTYDYFTGVTYGRPLIVDFSNVAVRDRDGNLVDVKLAGPWQATWRVPQSLTWSTEP